MARITKFGPFRHYRADPNQIILHFRGGRLVRSGTGLSGWFNPLTAAISELPSDDLEATLALQERSRDMQAVSVQVAVTFRITDAAAAANRINFSIDTATGLWQRQPAERMTSLWLSRAQPLIRAYIEQATLAEAIVSGPGGIEQCLAASLSADTVLKEAGLTLVDVHAIRVAPSAELEKALQTPARELIQQRADEATFQRRAMAVEKERAIRENELATEVELARRQEELIRRRGDNLMLDARQRAEVAKIEAESGAEASRIQSAAEAAAIEEVAHAEAAGDHKRAEVWRSVPGRVLLGMAIREFAGKVSGIQHLNITPDLVGQAFGQFMVDHSAEGK